MIDPKVFAMGATSIRVEVAKWKSDGVSPAIFRCVIETSAGEPSAFKAERDNALQAERECVESFLAYFSSRKKSVHPHTINLRDKVDSAGPATVKPAKKIEDDYEY